MALIVTCPNCAATLKTRQRITCGDPAVCPKCNKEFIAADIVEESTRPDLPPELPATDPRSALPVRLEPKSQKSMPAVTDEGARGRDEDSFPVRYQSRDEEESSRNRSRAAYDDDDDDKPSRGRGDEDDERRANVRSRDDEDRPFRKRYRDDEGDRMTTRSRAVTKRRRRRRGQNRNVLYFVISFAGALSLMGIVLLIVYLVRKGDGEEEMLAYLPADTHMVVFVDFDAIANKRTPFGPMDEFRFESEIMREDVEKMIYAESEKNGLMAVLRLKSSFNKARFLDKTQATERKENGKTYYSIQRGPGYAYLASSSLLVFAEREDTMREMLRRDLSKPIVSDSIREVVREVSPASVWVVATEQKGPRGFGGLPNLMAGGFEPGETRAIAVSMKFSGDQMDIKIAIMATSAESASRWRDRLQRDIDQARRNMDDEMRHSPRSSENLDERRKLINSASVDRSGLLVTISCSGRMPWGERDRPAGGNRDFFQMFR
jgi:hypothetical protein